MILPWVLARTVREQMWFIEIHGEVHSRFEPLARSNLPRDAQSASAKLKKFVGMDVAAQATTPLGL